MTYRVPSYTICEEKHPCHNMKPECQSEENYPCHNTKQHCQCNQNYSCQHKFDNNDCVCFNHCEANQGYYFIGQTPMLTQTTDNAMVALVNPITSTANVYINVQTISNLSGSLATAYFYIGGTLPTSGTISPFISVSNTTINPVPNSNAQIQYILNSSYTPLGVSQFMRLIPTNQTLVDDIGGRIILAPGRSLVVLLQGLIGNVAMAFGWWEKQLNYRC